MIKAKSKTKVGRRISREIRTVSAMVRIYCRVLHGKKVEDCEECSGFLSYATMRLERCPYQEDKPTCARCLTHCYQPKRREQVREIMRFSGPRMMWSYPVLALFHVLDGLRASRGKKKP